MSYVLLLMFFVVEYVRPTSYVPALMVLKLNSLIPFGAFAGSLSSGTATRAMDWISSDVGVRFVLGMLAVIGLSVIFADVQMFAWERFTTVLGFAIIYWVMSAELTSVRRIQGVIMMLVAVQGMLSKPK